MRTRTLTSHLVYVAQVLTQGVCIEVSVHVWPARHSERIRTQLFIGFALRHLGFALSYLGFALCAYALDLHTCVASICMCTRLSVRTMYLHNLFVD